MRTIVLLAPTVFSLITGFHSATADAANEVRFSGTLIQPAPGEGQVLRQFEVLLLDSLMPFFCVLDDEREGCPWPESFGRLVAAGGPKPHVLYKFDGSLYSIPLPPLKLSLPDNIEAGTSWSDSTWTYEVVSKQKSDDAATWKVNARERRGRRQQLSVAADTGLLLDAAMDVFMGQGEKFELVLKKSSSTAISEDKAEQTEKIQLAMLALQLELKRRPDSQLAELSPRQVESAAAQLESLSTLARDTPLQETILRVRRDVERQQRRVAQTMNRQEQLLNQPAPSFTLNLVSGGSLNSDSLKGRTLVIHFWNYADKPLSEPYGQVGYLEFLNSKRNVNGLTVVGVATNPTLQQKETLRSGQRMARKLIEFMNLSYSVGYDDGSLLRAFGDPRESGGELPLWIVVSPQGNIVHYHSGFYEVDARLGLKELDDVLVEQLQASGK